jgi:hypothetical protein
MAPLGAHAFVRAPVRAWGTPRSFGCMQDLKRSGGKRGAMAATTDLLGERHIMIPAGTAWFA